MERSLLSQRFFVFPRVQSEAYNRVFIYLAILSSLSLPLFSSITLLPSLPPKKMLLHSNFSTYIVCVRERLLQLCQKHFGTKFSHYRQSTSSILEEILYLHANIMMLGLIFSHKLSRFQTAKGLRGLITKPLVKADLLNCVNLIEHTNKCGS